MFSDFRNLSVDEQVSYVMISILTCIVFCIMMFILDGAFLSKPLPESTPVVVEKVDKTYTVNGKQQNIKYDVVSENGKLTIKTAE